LHAANLADKPALVCEDRSLSWQELKTEVDSLANQLFEEIGPQAAQQVVAILLPNGWPFVVTYLAIIKLGHVALPLDPAYKKLEHDAIIDQIPSVLVVTDADYKHQISAHKQPTVLFEQLSNGQGQSVELLRLDPTEQIASLTFTSGTTGRPKAVPNTHANHIWNIKVCSEVWDWTAQDTLLNSVPLSHMLGIVMGLSGILYHGNTMYLQEWFDEKQTLEVLASGKISFFSHAASAYIKLLQYDDGKTYDLSSVRLCISGGAPLPPAVWREFKDRFEIEILETYGSSETGRIAGNALDKRVLGSPGKVLPGVKLRIGEHNEVQVKSGGLFPGYYQNPEATAASLTDDGYWRTGDIGELKDGYVFLKGRSQERIRRFSYTISPRDVEWALYKNPSIKDVYVMGRQQAGEPNDEMIYFIVGDITKDEVTSYCKQNLPFAWRPDKIILLDELPRTPSGKPKIESLKRISKERG
jgi:fatty-acyl-CoA synthase/long-chain acyl-CoA synthetase